MKTLEKSNEKIQQICKVLKEETLQPAKAEAKAIIEKAREEASHIIKGAEKEAEQLHAAARMRIEQEKSVLHSSLKQSGKQAVQALRQEIEEKLFSQELAALIEKGSSNPQVIAHLIDSLIKAIDKDGIKAELSAVIPSSVDSAQVSAALAKNSIEKLKGHPLKVGHFRGGAQVKWLNKRLTIDVTDEALMELLSEYVRKDFRELLFGK